MIVTSSLIALQIMLVKGYSPIFALLFFGFFGFIDALFWGALLKKVPEGAYVPLAIGAFITICCTLWTWAKGLEHAFDVSHRMRLSTILRTIDIDDEDAARLKSLVEEDEGEDEGSEASGASEAISEKSLAMATGARVRLTAPVRRALQPLATNRSLELQVPPGPLRLARTPSIALFQTSSSGKGAPHSFTTFCKRFPVLPQVVVFFTVRQTLLPRLPNERDRYVCTKIRAYEGFYTAVMRVGYREQIDLTKATDEVVARICQLERDTLGDEGVAARVQGVLDASKIRSHFLPYYYVEALPSNLKNSLARKISTCKFPLAGSASGTKAQMGRWRSTVIRKFLLEDIYQRIDILFPFESDWVFDAQTVLRIGITADL